MKVTVLVENSIDKGIDGADNLESAHGLALYIEIEKHKILFDIGPDDKIINNAEIMGIDLTQVDTVIISHGHNDHGGGLEAFFKINSKARVYLHKYATDDLYSSGPGRRPAYIGLDKELIERNSSRFTFIEKDMEIFPGLKIFEHIEGQFPRSITNGNLSRKEEDKMMPDDFRHEIVASLEIEGSRYIFTGCAHSGIVNMVNRVLKDSREPEVSAVFGGFHLYSGGQMLNAPPEYLEALIKELKALGMDYYSGHCTGHHNFNVIKEELGPHLKHLNTGCNFNF